MRREFSVVLKILGDVSSGLAALRKFMSGLAEVGKAVGGMVVKGRSGGQQFAKGWTTPAKGIAATLDATFRKAQQSSASFLSSVTTGFSRARGLVSSFVDGFGKIGLAAAGLQTVGNAIGGIGRALLGGQTQFEQYTVAFTMLIRNSDDFKRKYRNVTDPLELQALAAKEAQARIQELSVVGQKTPFELPGLVEADRILQAFDLHSQQAAQTFGFSGSQIRTIAADTAAAAQVDLAELSRYIGQFSKGSTGEAIARFQELGIVTRDELARMGLEFSKSGELLSPLDEATNVLLTAMKNKFGGMAEAQSATLGGMISNFKDWIGNAGRILGGPIFEPFKQRFGELLSFLGTDQVTQTLQRLGENIGAAFTGMLSLGERVFPIVRAGALSLWAALQQLWTALQVGLDLLRPVFTFVADNAQPILAGLAAVATKLLIPALLTLGKGAILGALGALGTALTTLLSPLSLLGIAAFLLFKAWQNNFLGLRDLTDRAVAAVTPILSSAKDALDTFGQSLGAIFRLLQMGDFEGGIFGLSEDHPFINALFIARGAVLTLVNTVRELWSGDVAGALQAFTGGFSEIGAQLGDLAAEAGPRLLDFGRTLLTQATAWGRSLWTWVHDAIPPLLARLGEVASTVGDWITTYAPMLGHSLLTWATVFASWIGESLPGWLNNARQFAARIAAWVQEQAPI